MDVWGGRPCPPPVDEGGVAGEALRAARGAPGTGFGHEPHRANERGHGGPRHMSRTSSGNTKGLVAHAPPNKGGGILLP